MADSKVPPYQTFAVQIPATKEAALVTFTQPVIFTYPAQTEIGAVAAAGSGQTDAAAVPNEASVVVSDGDGAKGVILPASAAIGSSIRIYGSAAGDLKVYPHSGGTINDGSANAAVTIEGRTDAVFTRSSATNWTAGYVTAS